MFIRPVLRQHVGACGAFCKIDKMECVPTSFSLVMDRISVNSQGFCSFWTLGKEEFLRLFSYEKVKAEVRSAMPKGGRFATSHPSTGLLRDRIFDSVPEAIAANFYPENETALPDPRGGEIVSWEVGKARSITSEIELSTD